MCVNSLELTVVWVSCVGGISAKIPSTEAINARNIMSWSQQLYRAFRWLVCVPGEFLIPCLILQMQI